MTHTHDTIALAQQIAQHHAQLQIGQPLSPAEAALPADAHLPEVQSAVLQGARMLGFIEADTQCVAQAWQHQTQRLGQFDPLHWPDQAVDFQMPAWPRQNAFAPSPRALGLYAVLPNAQWVARMAQAGVPTLQLRFKSDKPAEVAAEVRAAVKAVEATGALLFINDHWQHAIDAGAYGVHLGQEDLDSSDLLAIRKAGLRLGLSTHGYAEMMRADALSPSYIAMGAVFPTTLKNMPTAPQGLGRLGAYAKLMQGHSLVAIGGIDEARFADVRHTGMGSIAVVRALLAATDPVGTTKDLIRRMAGI